jgi:hypothetical protein
MSSVTPADKPLPSNGIDDGAEPTGFADPQADLSQFHLNRDSKPVPGQWIGRLGFESG